MKYRAYGWRAGRCFSVLLLGLGACSGDEHSITEVPPQVWIEPSSAAVALGDSLTLRLMEEPQTDRDAAQDITGRVHTWEVSDPTVLDSSAALNGIVTGLSTGEATVTAHVSGRDPVTASITIVPPGMRSLRIAPRATRIRPGETAQLTVYVGYADGSEVPVPGDRTIEWTSNNPSVADVDEAGVVVAWAAGPEPVTSVQITAMKGNLPPATALVEVTTATIVSMTVQPDQVVLEPDESRNLRAQCRYSDGSTEECTEAASWSCIDDSVCTCEAGRLIAVGPGRSSCVASMGQQGVSAEVTVQVGSCNYTELRLSPPNQTIPLGARSPLIATAVYDCNLEEDVSAQIDLWTPSPTGIVAVNDEGELTALAMGTAAVTATYRGRSSNSVNVEVVDAQPVKIACTPPSRTAEQGDEVCFEPTLIYTDGSRDPASWSWSIRNAAVADQVTGRPNCFVGRDAGSTTIQVSAPGVAVSPGLCELEVLGPTQCEVDPGGANLLVSETAQFDVKLVGAGGELVPLPSQVSPRWSLTSTTVVSIRSDGFVEAIGTGFATIDARVTLGGHERRCRPATVFVAERCASFPGNFENGMAPWRPTNAVWEVGEPTSGPGGCAEGRACAATILDGNFPAGPSSAFISPAVDICSVRPGEVVELWFEQYFSYHGPNGSYNGSGDYGSVWMDVNVNGGCGDHPDCIQVGREFRLGSGGRWSPGRIDITPFAGRSAIRFAFWHTDRAGYAGNQVSFGWAIDDVRIIKY